MEIPKEIETTESAEASTVSVPTPSQIAAEIQVQRVLDELRPVVQTLDRGFATLFGIARRVQSGNLTQALTPDLCARYGTTPEKAAAVFAAIAQLQPTVAQAQEIFDGVL